MKKHIIILILFIGILNFNFAQTTFEYLHQGPNDQWPGEMIEDENGNIIFAFFDKQEKSANLIKVDNSGQILNSYNYFEPNYKSRIKELILLDDGTFIGIGVYNKDSIYNLWYCRFDLNLNLLYDNKIPVDYEIASDRLNSIINVNNNIVIGATYMKDFYFTDLSLFEITINGDLLKEEYYISLNPGTVVFYDLFEIPNSTNYKIFITGFSQKSLGRIFTVDSAFNILYHTPFNWWDSENHTAKILDDDSYLLGLVKYESKDNPGSGLVKHSMNEVVLDSILIWEPGITNYTAWFKSIDFVDNSQIYFGSTYDMTFFNPFYSTSPSWFMLNKLDDDLNPIWQKYYGGDACYNLWSILATQDGGCVMAGSRYDYQTQNQERDVYILKVNEDGLMTWTYNFPETQKIVHVYPNPGQDELNINCPMSDLKFELYNSGGAKMISKELTQFESSINTAFFIPGIYIYEIIDKQGQVIETGKWIKI